MPYLIFIFILLFSSCKAQSVYQKPATQLQLKNATSIKQLVQEDKKRFDLSGIVKYQNNIYVIADKEWNNHLYRIDTLSSTFSIASAKQFPPKNKIDFEGISVCNDKALLIEELNNDVYQTDFSTGELIDLEIPWMKFNIDTKNWGNRGLEGLAYDCANDILYLAKERQPRRIFKVDLKNNTITEPFSSFINSDKQGYDITDMKFENGNLYILERGLGLVTKINTKTKVRESLSFHHIVLKNNQRLYNNGNPAYGMAEALLLTKDEIWVGLDNNGDEVSKYGKTLGLKGNTPVIFIFKRPEGF